MAKKKLPTKKTPKKRAPKKKPVTVAAVVETPPLPLLPYVAPDIYDSAERAGLEGVFDMPNEELPPEPFYPHWTDSFQLEIITRGIQHLKDLGYKVLLDDANAPDSQPPVAQVHQDQLDAVLSEMLPRDTKVTGVTKLKDGTNIVEYAPTGFVKHDAGKTRFSLVPPEARLEIAKVFTHGAKKYPPHNYRKGTDWSRYIDALLRHMTDFELGQNVDEESGLLTLAHVAACAMILLTLQKLGKGSDDRAPSEEALDSRPIL